MRTIRVGYLNLAMPAPHSPQRYIELFRAMFRLKESVSLRGDFKGMLGSVKANQGQITGEVYKFFDLDLGDNWFDVVKQKKAEEEDLASLSVPENLKPHLRTLEYVFFPKKHRLAFVAKDKKDTLSPDQAETLFATLLSFESVVAKFGEVSVTVEPSKEQLSKILKMPILQRLRLEITPPNPDDLEEAEQELLEELNALNARRMVIEYAAPRSESLTPDERLTKLAKIAQSNGKVSGVGRAANGEHENLSTKEHPLLEDAIYNENVQPRLSALVERASETVNEI